MIVRESMYTLMSLISCGARPETTGRVSLHSGFPKHHSIYQTVTYIS